MGTEPSSLQIEITNEQAAEHPKIFTKLHLIYRVRDDAPGANLNKAIGLSLSKYFPVITWVQLPSATVKGVFVEKNTSYGVRKPSVFLGR